VGVDAYRYDGKRVLVVGGATGMGAAAAKIAASLGAEIVVMDVAEVAFDASRKIRVDLRDRQSTDAALDQISGPVDAVFACAGVADGTAGLMRINFIAQRHLIDRLIATERLRRGGSIAMISSVAGMMWQKNMATVLEFLETKDWDSAVAWIESHPGTENYAFSKQAINAYVAHEALPLLQRGVRINAVLPGPTETPLARANADLWLTFGADYRAAAGVEVLTPEQVGHAIAFLCSPAASGVCGTTLLIDSGHVGAGITGAIDAPIVKILAGLT
jgi:NAD(P)-dependent dehydrogenase (short-subunit alcohol dehydrogenase family)